MPMPYLSPTTARVSPSAYRLRIELIPERQWGVNLRALMSETQWSQVSAAVFESASHRCEICGGVGRAHPLECHETWLYDEDPNFARPRRAQILTGMQALCPPCHRVKHLGFADKSGWLDASLDHLATVNGISTREARAYLEAAYVQQRRRASMRWDQDISWFRERFPGRLRDERAARKGARSEGS